MEKINITELLKDCPIGTKLYSPLCGECRVSYIYDGLGFDVICGDDTVYNFSYDGRYNIMGECCIFPSKECRDWSTFQRPFKDGDVIYTDNFIAILSNIEERGTVWYYCYYCIDTKKFKAKRDFGIGNINYDEFRFATEEEKQKLFDAIKAKGYKWNAETKTLEKLIKPKFKVGDKIKYKNGKNIDGVEQGVIISITDDTYDVAVTNDMGIFVPITDQYEWELIPNKFDIANLKPFEKVLVRQNVHGIWGIDFFGFYNYDEGYYYTTGNCVYVQCIPYEGNEHLLGTTDDCDDFYKTWE